MEFIHVDKEEPLAIVTLERGKVNAINEQVVSEFEETFRRLNQEDSVRAVIVTSRGKFFSFGFDVPEFLSYTKRQFERYLCAFANLYQYLFLYPKPVIAAINGHCVAAGCMLSNACDYRVMVDRKAKISLNEIAFGSAVFAGSVEILRFLVGSERAQQILVTGRMYDPLEAVRLCLVEQVVPPERLMAAAREVAREYADKNPPAYAQIKRLLREPIVNRYRDREEASILRFNDIWYTPEMRERLKQIEIRA